MGAAMKLKLTTIASLFGLIAVLISPDIHAYSAWTDNSTYEAELGKAKIRVYFNVRTIDVYPITQNNCIFYQLEENPEPRTSSNYRQPHCASLRNQRVEASGNQEMPKGTKITRVPANTYFKIDMEVSSQMSNRVGEEFGIQIIDAETKTTEFLEGGWKPGDRRLSKAIKLEPGRYFWRCPVNPTPWYGLIAE